MGQYCKPQEISRAVGATRALDACDAEAVAAVDADVVIESSGSHRGLASAIPGATHDGTVVMVGPLPNGDQSIPVSHPSPGNYGWSGRSGPTTRSTR
ncbi:hypothetical protein ACFV80_00405 [Streptomyces sp. NPDC059862]|uniref:hypothetical protein n=1 Tax=Streptomyces sp. NPDC059862 TaxID=3346975 RepID=UPI0036572D41